MTTVVNVVIHCVFALLSAKYISGYHNLDLERITRMPINCKQPNVYQCGKSWTTEANEYHSLSCHFFEHKLSRNIVEIAAALADSHGGDHTAQFVAASHGAAANCECISVCRHAILHWSFRKQPQRIEFEIK